MRPLSYAQNLEDWHLALAFEGQAVGTYVDVGAGHPIADNVTQFFYERGWSGLVVEPQAALAALYPLLRPRDRVHQGLAGAETGWAAFHEVAGLHGLSTTVAENAAEARRLGAEARVRRLPVAPLAALCRGHGIARIDVLKVDVEGAEAAVLAGHDWTDLRPGIVLVEAVAPGSGLPAWEAFEPFLLARGYRFRLFDTLNRFYVAEERPDLLERLPAERAPWDCATHLYEIGRAPENPAHPDHALATALARGLHARLPHLDPALVADLAAAGGLAPPDLATDAGRAALGRIACGYDGGQIHGDVQEP
jgi:FkbM family methyltransferase